MSKKMIVLYSLVAICFCIAVIVINKVERSYDDYASETGMVQTPIGDTGVSSYNGITDDIELVAELANKLGITGDINREDRENATEANEFLDAQPYARLYSIYNNGKVYYFAIDENNRVIQLNQN